MTSTINSQIENIKAKKKKTTPKRIIIISIVTLIIGTLLFVPYHGVYKDGGTQEWRALGYVVVKWHRIYMEGTPEKPVYKNRNDLRVYIFPLSLLDNGTLYKMEYGE